MATEKKGKKVKKVKEMKIREIVNMYNLLKKVNLLKLDKNIQYTVLRLGSLIKPTATHFEDFQKETIERLRPENFEVITEKQTRYNELSPDEKAEVDNAFMAYDRRVSECVATELEKVVSLEYEDIEPVDFDGLAQIGSNNTINVIDLLVIKEATD